MTDRTCSNPACNEPRYGKRAWCNRCYFQRYRNGSMGVDRTRAGRSWGHSHGYRLVTRHGHPLANTRGAVYVHRLMLWDAVGPGDQACHWCGASVSWDKRHPEPGALEVDHLDSDPTHNDRANLVPSCHSCNTRRALAHRWSQDDPEPKSTTQRRRRHA